MAKPKKEISVEKEEKPLLVGRISIAEAFTKKSGEKVKLAGWVHDSRALGKIKFLILRDITGRIQTVAFKGEAPEDVFEKASKIVKYSEYKYLFPHNLHAVYKSTERFYSLGDSKTWIESLFLNLECVIA